MYCTTLFYLFYLFFILPLINLFYVPKVKSDEIKNIFKWRNMISQALHPLRRFSKLVGRCLSLLVKGINIFSPYFSLPAMIGVRDMFSVSSRARWTTLPTQQLEMDIDNCFWNLDKEGVLKAVGYIAERVRRGRKVQGDFWFSIVKGGDKTLDHYGKGSEKKHRTVNVGHVLKFVKWDVFHDTEFVFGSVVLAQRAKASRLLGCFFYGFLPAQLCVLWGVIHELLIFDDAMEEKRRGWYGLVLGNHL